MISECDLDGNGNLFGAPRQQGRRLLPAEGAIISVDDHVIEHPRVWIDRLPGKYSDVAPESRGSGPQRHLALRMRPVTSGRRAQAAAKLAKLFIRRGWDANACELIAAARR